jgi:hypothetical protein
MTLATVSFKHSVIGKASFAIELYLLSFIGFLGSLGSNPGGGRSYDLKNLLFS